MMHQWRKRRWKQQSNCLVLLMVLEKKQDWMQQSNCSALQRMLAKK